MADDKGFDWGGMIGGALGPIMGLFGKDAADRRQVNQQRELNKVNSDTAKEMGKFNYDQAFKMWNETNLPAQVKQAKEAGMSVGNLYGGSGAGGAISAAPMSASAGSPDGAAATRGADTQMGMLGAQLALLGSQKKNIDADTLNKLANAPKAEADTENVKEQTRGTKFENDLRSLFKPEEEDTRKQELDARKAGAEKTELDAKAWKDAGFKQGTRTDDMENPIMKQKAAEFETAVQALKNAKQQGSLTAAQTAVENFKASMAGMGISPDSPWYVKTLMELGKKAGIKLN